MATKGNEPDGLNGRERDLYVSLRYYLETLLGERQRLIELQFTEHYRHHDQLAENIRTALAQQDNRLDAMNEFRGSLEDMTRQMVKRDMFDLVTERVGVVENTYVKGKDYQADARREAEQLGKDFDERDRRVETLERNIVGRDAFGGMTDRIVALEKTAVTHDALTAQREAAERSRKSLTYALVAVGAAAIVNLIVNAYQGARSGVG